MACLWSVVYYLRFQESLSIYSFIWNMQRTNDNKTRSNKIKKNNTKMNRIYQVCESLNVT